MSLKKYTLSEEARQEMGQDIVGMFTGAPDVICAEHWRTSVWDIVCTMLAGCSKGSKEGRGDVWMRAKKNKLFGEICENPTRNLWDTVHDPGH
jgi:purine nucleoside phosphorylase